jgi:hypothetical protein
MASLAYLGAASRVEGLRLFEECQALLSQKCLTMGIGAKEGYAELVQRHQGRYEMRYGMEGPLFCRPELLENPVLTNVRMPTSLDHAHDQEVPDSYASEVS